VWLGKRCTNRKHKRRPFKFIGPFKFIYCEDESVSSVWISRRTWRLGTTIWQDRNRHTSWLHRISLAVHDKYR
jgi:hypothetical protein